MKENDNPPINRLINIGGATASITIIALILYLLKIIPENVSLSIAFFVSLPIVFTFIFGIIFNKQNFGQVFRHYSFTAYIIAAFVIYLIVLNPSNIAEGIRYSFHFLLGLVIAIIGYFVYYQSYKISSKWTRKYRWRALSGFSVSFIITLIITFVLRHFKIFELV